MKVIFRVDASLKMGTGHVMRCLTFAEKLKENTAQVEFICRKHKGNLIDKILERGFKVYSPKSTNSNFKNNSKLRHSQWLGTTQVKDARECINIVKHKEIDWLIVDHYSLDEEWQNYLKPFCKKLFVIDDLADRKHKCDVLLDQTYGTEERDYKDLVPSKCKLLLGSEYGLLRPEFFKLRDKSLNSRNNPKLQQLLINMGGIDSDNITESILTQLRLSDLPKEIMVKVVMGSNSPHLESVKSKSKDMPFSTEVLVEVDDMAELMAQSDLAIGASGSTTWERCCLGLPSIQIVTAENQKNLAEKLAKENIVRLIEDVKEISKILTEPIDWMKSASSLSKDVCDGLGSNRVFNSISNSLIFLDGVGEVDLYNYVNLTEDDRNLVLSMRNHPKVKMWMHNQNEISNEEHVNFIKSLESSIDKRYFLIKNKKTVAGAINFRKIKYSDSVEFGIFTNPFSEVKELGRLLESVAYEYAVQYLNVDKIKLEVFESNDRAINFYNKCGFEYIKSKQVNNRKIVSMEKRTHL